MKVIMAVDNSRFSEIAVQSVADRPWPRETSFKIIYVIRRLSLFPTVLEQANPRISEVRRAMLDSAQMSVDRAANMLRERFGPSSVSCEIVEGHIAQTIINHAREWPADLIVVGSHGYSAMQEMLLGSVSRDVATHAQCSVEVVRKSGKGTTGLNKVLVPIDDSEHSQAGLDFIARNIWPEGCTMTLISVIPALSDAYELGSWNTLNLMKEQDKLAQVIATFLQKKARQLKKAIPNVNLKTGVLIGDVRKRILDEARRCEADLVILGSHGHGRLKGFLLGSVSQAILLHCPSSVQIIKQNGNSL